MKTILFTLLLFILLFSSCTDQRALVTSPEVIGIPPQNAYTGLVLLDDGEIRHYGNNMFISSRDDGHSWDSIPLSNGNFYGKKNPKNGEYLRIFSGGNDSVFSLRSHGGIDGEWIKKLIDTNGAIMLKPVVYCKNGSRALVAFHTKYRNGSGTYYSDDSGISWKKSNQVNSPAHEITGFHKGQRWNHGAVEPSVIELNDGRLWMLIRTAQDNHYESFSSDAGETWSEAVPSRFYGTITMPTLQRLKNGTILLIWSNTTPLPEKENKSDYWEDVFTNRDALHAAISDDDGTTWKGFREIYLNPLRNDSLMATRFGKKGSLDRSVHQSELVEIDSNQVIISLGQHPNFRKLIKLDLNWLYEKETSDNFSDGLNNWSIHNYLKGIKGHCAYNRKPGAFLIPHPDDPSKHVMHLKTKKDTTLLYANSGALYNFPSGFKGTLTMRIKIIEGFDGLNISLHDRWFNPVDTTAKNYAMFNLRVDENLLKHESWHELKFKWNTSTDSKSGVCEIFIDGKKIKKELIQNFKTVNGISNIHFILDHNEKNNEGVLLESIHTLIE